jgi:hypothetical protein
VRSRRFPARPSRSRLALDWPTDRLTDRPASRIASHPLRPHSVSNVRKHIHAEKERKEKGKARRDEAKQSGTKERKKPVRFLVFSLSLCVFYKLVYRQDGRRKQAEIAYMLASSITCYYCVWQMEERTNERKSFSVIPLFPTLAYPVWHTTNAGVGNIGKR